VPDPAPIASTAYSGEKHFRWRGADVSRIEGLSDAVFALCLALLALNVDVPQTYAEMQVLFFEVPAFLATFAILGMIWHTHYLFFRRYGLRDGLTTFLNAILLFLVLLYVYPLKFLFTAVFDLFFSGFSEPPHNAQGGVMFGGEFGWENMRTLMMIYAIGYATVFGVFVLLYQRAWAYRELLNLDDVEGAYTLQYRRINMIHVGFGLTSFLIAFVLPNQQCHYAGWLFGLTGPVFYWNGRNWDKQLKGLLAQREPAAS
jgi:hypothetical protein